MISPTQIDLLRLRLIYAVKSVCSTRLEHGRLCQDLCPTRSLLLTNRQKMCPRQISAVVVKSRLRQSTYGRKPAPLNLSISQRVNTVCGSVPAHMGIEDCLAGCSKTTVSVSPGPCFSRNVRTVPRVGSGRIVRVNT